MLSLVILGLAGLFAGAAISAAKHRAPRRTVITFLVLTGVALIAAVMTFAGN